MSAGVSWPKIVSILIVEQLGYDLLDHVNIDWFVEHLFHADLQCVVNYTLINVSSNRHNWAFSLHLSLTEHMRLFYMSLPATLVVYNLFRKLKSIHFRNLNVG